MKNFLIVLLKNLLFYKHFLFDMVVIHLLPQGFEILQTLISGWLKASFKQECENMCFQPKDLFLLPKIEDLVLPSQTPKFVLPYTPRPCTSKHPHNH
jgi:hypothetical protein